MRVEVIHAPLGPCAAFAIVEGPGYQVIILNSEDTAGRPLSPQERADGVAQWLALADNPAVQAVG